MAKNEIKTETTAEQYLVEIIGPRIEAIEETIESLKEDQTIVLNAVKESNDALKTKFEEMRTAKAQGRQFMYCNKDSVDASIKKNINEILSDNLIQRTIKVETTAKVHIPDNELASLKAQEVSFKEWMSSNKKRQEAYEKSRRPFIKINFTNKWFLILSIALVVFTSFSIGYVHYGVHQTPQNWADRNYEAALELDEENPGAAYHDVLQDFKNGYAAAARQKVSDREVAAKERTKKKKEYEKRIKCYLSLDDSLGLRVVNYLEKIDTDGKFESLVFCRIQNCNDLQFVAYISDNEFIRITVDSRVTTIEKARRYASQKIWKFVGNLSEPIASDKLPSGTSIILRAIK